MVTLEQILVILIILWALGFITGVGGDLIHLLLVVVLVVYLLRILGVVI